MEETTHYTGKDFDSLVDLTVRMGKICAECAELEDGGNTAVEAARMGLRAIITHSIDKQVEQLGGDYLDCLWATHQAAQESAKDISAVPIYDDDDTEVSARWEIMCVLEQMIDEREQAAA